MFDEKMRAQGRKVCLHLDNFSGHYISYEPTNVELMFFKPNLTAWVQPLDAGIIRCFKAHYRRRFCQEALKRDASGEADIYSFNLLEALHMARDAWENVTPETIKNCWNHADIQRDPIILRIPSTLTQRGWNVIHKFADPPSGMTLPQAEDSLKEVFGNQYNDDDWRPALTLVTETEPDEDIHSLIKALREKPSRGSQPFTPNEYTEVAAEVTSEIKELERRNRIFEGAPSADAYIEPDVEREVEVDQIRTDDELVAEVVREQAIERGEIVEKEDEECEEEEPEMTTREIMSSITRLRKALLTRGDLCVRTAKMLALAQDEVAREEMRNARQMTLEWWFGGQVGHSE